MEQRTGLKTRLGPEQKALRNLVFINIFCLGLSLFNSDQFKFLSHTTHFLTLNDLSHKALPISKSRSVILDL